MMMMMSNESPNNIEKEDSFSSAFCDASPSVPKKRQI